MSHDLDARSNQDVGVVDSQHVMSGDRTLGHSMSGDQDISRQLTAGDHSLTHVMSGDGSLHHVTSGDQGLSHVTTGVKGSAMVMDMFRGEQSQIQNETQGKHWNQEQNTDSNQFQQRGTGIHATESGRLQSSVSKEGDCYNQGGGQFDHQSHHSQAEEADTKNSAQHEVKTPPGEEDTMNLSSKPAQPAVADFAVPLAAPVSLQDKMPHVTNPIPKQPTAVNALKRCTYETYSSDDDDVFLPNPPSKSQADKCIVAMATDEELDLPTIVTTAASDSGVAPDNGEVVAMETLKEEEEEEESEDKAMKEEREKAEARGMMCQWMLVDILM